jgi:hypothetical protein
MEERTKIEDEIERRGLWDRYLTELVDIIDIYGYQTYYDWDREWQDAVRAILRATPEQCRTAAARVLGDGA